MLTKIELAHMEKGARFLVTHSHDRSRINAQDSLRSHQFQHCNNIQLLIYGGDSFHRPAVYVRRAVRLGKHVVESVHWEAHDLCRIWCFDAYWDYVEYACLLELCAVYGF